MAGEARVDGRLLGAGEAPGKVILLGEHAVVYGRPALALPTLGRTVKVELREAPPGTPRGAVLLDLQPGPMEGRLDDLRAAVLDTRAAVGAPADPVVVKVRSTLPQEAGMGSSAALAVALARAFAAWIGRPLGREQAAEIAFATERRFHGRASGIDNTTSAWGEPLRYRIGAGAEPLRFRGEFLFLLVHSGVASSTRQAVAAVADLRRERPQPVEAAFDGIAEAVEAGQAALARGDADALGRAMARNQEWLRALEVSHPAVEAVIERALRAGARAAKLTGAGRGGLVLVLAGDDAEAQRKALPGAMELRLRGSAADA